MRVNPAKVVALLIAIGLPLFVTVTVEQGEQGDAVLLPGSGVPPLASTEAGWLRAAALNLGLGAVPQLSHLLRAAGGGAQKEEKELFGDTPKPRQGG